MVFISTLVDDGDYVALKRDGSAWLVLETIGYDDREDWSYSILVSLDVAAGGAYELIFCVVRHDATDGTDQKYWNGADTKAFLLGEDRDRIRTSVLHIIMRMVDLVKPPEMFMCTTEPNLPQKALVKYEIVLAGVTALGYKVREGEVLHGRRIWLMERDPEQPVSSE